MTKLKKKVLCGPSAEGLPYSRAMRAGDLVFISGIVAFGEDGNIIPGGITAETQLVLEELSSIMSEISGSLDDIVKVNICLPFKEDFDAFNKIYATFFTSEHPARATICATVNIAARVEIEAIAYMPIS